MRLNLALLGRPEALMFPRSFRAAVSFLHLIVFLIQFRIRSSEICPKISSLKNNIPLIYDCYLIQIGPSLLKNLPRLGRCIEKIPSEVVVTSEPQPWPSSKPEVLGSVVWTLWGSLWWWGYRTGPLWPVCNHRFGLQECWDVLAGVRCLPAGPGCHMRDPGSRCQWPAAWWSARPLTLLCTWDSAPDTPVLQLTLMTSWAHWTLGPESEVSLSFLIESDQCSLSSPQILLHSGDVVGPPPRCTGWLSHLPIHSFSQSVFFGVYLWQASF